MSYFSKEKSKTPPECLEHRLSKVWFYFPFVGHTHIICVEVESLRLEWAGGPVRSVYRVRGRCQAVWAGSSASQSGWPRLGRLLFVFFFRGVGGLPEFSSLELASKNETRQDAMCNSCLTSLATISCLISCLKAAVSFRVNSTVPSPDCLRPQRHRETHQASETQENNSASICAAWAETQREFRPEEM